ncbi:tyrosine-type recombinase/integrase [Microcoleus sp. N9_B2]|uniref:tyrosine-type recombinase/integrase n=1 Tax=unclassified Microcoleus TaxID=2642155 RepID=UPI002FD4F5F8
MRADKRPQPCDVTVYSDKGSLALRFPKRHNPLWEQLDGKSLVKPKCLGIGKYGYRDNPDDWKRATQLAIALEADLDHPEWEKLFDPTLAKYGLGGGKYAKLADVLQLPGAKQPEPEITVGEMWEAYLEWKKTVVEETTFKKAFGCFTNAIHGKVWSKKTKTYVQQVSPLSRLPLSNEKELELCLSNISLSAKSYFFTELNQAFEFCKTKGMLVNPTTENPFVTDKFSVPAVTTQQKYAPKIVNGEEKEWYEALDEKDLENDRRAFTKEERDIIIKAFYEGSSSKAFYAPLIEFYFLTGCRTSEALPLTWKDIDFERNLIRFNKSLGSCTKKVKETKTGEARLFYFSENSRLKEMLVKLKSETSSNLVFPSKSGKYHSQASIGKIWLGYILAKTLVDGTECTYYYPGVVTQLVESGKVGCYLSPYHTRHTYITLTANANKHDNNALLYIATACGNSVDVILRHYLGAAENTQIAEV